MILKINDLNHVLQYFANDIVLASIRLGDQVFDKKIAGYESCYYNNMTFLRKYTEYSISLCNEYSARIFYYKDVPDESDGIYVEIKDENLAFEFKLKYC